MNFFIGVYLCVNWDQANQYANFKGGKLPSKSEYVEYEYAATSGGKNQSSYAGAPTDGSAFKGSGSIRVLRGGSFYSEDAGSLRADLRLYGDPGDRRDGISFRLARSSR